VRPRGEPRPALRRRPRRRDRRGGRVRPGDPRQRPREEDEGLDAREGHLRRPRGLVPRRRRSDQSRHADRRHRDEPRLTMTVTTRPARTTPPAALVGGVGGLLVLAAISCLIGVAGMSWEVLWVSRLPRTIGLVLAGAALAVCGLLMQLLVRNRFVEPSTVGTTEAAGLGLVVITLLVPGSPLMVKMVTAALFALAGTWLFLRVVRLMPVREPILVPLIGL